MGRKAEKDGNHDFNMTLMLLCKMDIVRLTSRYSQSINVTFPTDSDRFGLNTGDFWGCLLHDANHMGKISMQSIPYLLCDNE